MKTKFILIACCLFACSAVMAGTIQQKIIPTSQFTREASTNETAAQWRTKIDVVSAASSAATSNQYRADLLATNNLLVTKINTGLTTADNNTLSYLNQLRTAVAITNLAAQTAVVTNLYAGTNFTKTGYITNLNSTTASISTGNVTNLNTVGAYFSGGVTNAALASAIAAGTVNLMSVSSSGVLGLISWPIQVLAKFNGSTTVTNATGTNTQDISNLTRSYNVASVIHTNTGKYFINFSNAFANANYVVQLTEDYTNASYTIYRGRVITQLTNQLSISYTNGQPSAADMNWIYLTIFP